MTTYTVSTSAQLAETLAHVRSGDIVNLTAGTYSALTLRDIDINGNVTIQSADPRHAATLTGLNVRDSSGLTFRNLEFAVGTAMQNPFQVNGSRNILFDHLDVHGSLNDDPGDDMAAMLIRTSSNVTVRDSEFQQLQHGIGYLDSNGVSITGNMFHDIRTDGVRGGGTSNLTISGNYFTDFYPAAGDHPDAIQLWTTNTTRSVSNITITDNVIARGDGAPTQGIFLRDQVGTLPYRNVVITGNALVGTGYNGIAVDHATNLTIAGNDIASFAGQTSWIRIERIAGGALLGNTAAHYINEASTNVRLLGNVVTDALSPATAAALGSWIDAHDDGTVALLLHGLQARLDKLLDASLQSAGSALLDEAAKADWLLDHNDAPDAAPAAAHGEGAIAVTDDLIHHDAAAAVDPSWQVPSADVADLMLFAERPGHAHFNPFAAGEVLL